MRTDMVSVLIFRYGSFYNFHHKALTSSNPMSVFMGCQASMRDPPPLTIKPILLSRLSSITLASLKIPKIVAKRLLQLPDFWWLPPRLPWSCTQFRTFSWVLTYFCYLFINVPFSSFFGQPGEILGWTGLDMRGIFSLLLFLNWSFTALLVWILLTSLISLIA